MQSLFLADVRIALQAVDKLELRHLVNCLVFPQLACGHMQMRPRAGTWMVKIRTVLWSYQEEDTTIERRSL